MYLPNFAEIDDVLCLNAVKGGIDSVAEAVFGLNVAIVIPFLITAILISVI